MDGRFTLTGELPVEDGAVVTGHHCGVEESAGRPDEQWRDMECVKEEHNTKINTTQYNVVGLHPSFQIFGHFDISCKAGTEQ